jgi:phospholipase C
MGMNSRTRDRLFGHALLAIGAAVVLSSCTAPTSASHVPTVRQTQLHAHRKDFSTPIQHVVVIIQENRSVDNIFNGFPGADTTRTGFDSHGNMHTLQSVSFSAQCDPSHSHPAFVNEFNNGALNGWDLETVTCHNGNSLPDGAFAFVSNAGTSAYWNVASNYAFADEVFQTNEGPSMPAHEYLIAGQSGGHGIDAPWAFSENGGGSSSRDTASEEVGTDGRKFCGGAATMTVTQIDLTSSYPGTEGNPIFPCKDYQTIFDLAMGQSPPLTWKYYAHKAGNVWSGTDFVQHLWQNPGWRAVIPETTVLTDIATHNLANIVYVTPSPGNSDHPHASSFSQFAGPKWVASIVNAIGNDPYYWGNTTILIVWDDWGGWFDHAVYGATMHPPGNPTDPYEYGFRVPLVVVSPYVNAHMIDHTQRTFDSIMAYIETTFNLGNLGMQDTTTDDLSDMFNYSQAPLQFIPMPNGKGRAGPSVR